MTASVNRKNSAGEALDIAPTPKSLAEAAARKTMNWIGAADTAREYIPCRTPWRSPPGSEAAGVLIRAAVRATKRLCSQRSAVEECDLERQALLFRIRPKRGYFLAIGPSAIPARQFATASNSSTHRVGRMHVSITWRSRPELPGNGDADLARSLPDRSAA